VAKKALAVTCLAPKLKEILTEHLGKLGASEDLVKAFDALPACKGGSLIEFNKKAAGAKSAYSQFASTCMKELTGPVTERMKVCAAKWQEQKGK